MDPGPCPSPNLTTTAFRPIRYDGRAHAYLVDQPSRTVLLSMKDDSMSGAGLMPGDTLVVKLRAPAQPGDVVVAIVDHEFTVKYLAHDPNGFFLEPGNPAYAPIRSSEALEIYGRVVASFRKYPSAGCSS